MILVFGGAYQGKREFAIRELGIGEEDILNVDEIAKTIPDINDQDLAYSLEGFLSDSIKTAKCIYGFDSFARVLTAAGRSSERWVENNLANMKNSIIIMQDLSQGLVPMDPGDREFREENGRAMSRLAGEAEAVYRVFCGIGSRIK